MKGRVGGSKTETRSLKVQQTPPQVRISATSSLKIIDERFERPILGRLAVACVEMNVCPVSGSAKARLSVWKWVLLTNELCHYAA